MLHDTLAEREETEKRQKIDIILSKIFKFIFEIVGTQLFVVTQDTGCAQIRPRNMTGICKREKPEQQLTLIYNSNSRNPFLVER
jgi:hypothetical protein